MNIYNLYYSLTLIEKFELRHYVLERENYDDGEKSINFRCSELKSIIAEMKSRGTGMVTIEDFCRTIPISVRLHNILKSISYYPPYYMYLDHIDKKAFLFKRNAGIKSWKELMNIVFNSLKGTKFELYEDKLKSYFEEQDKGTVNNNLLQS
jgi:hypothetical protein